MTVNVQNNRRIIRIAGGSIHLSPDAAIPLSHTSLKPETMRFRPGREFYWLIEICQYNRADGSIVLKVLDYNPRETAGFLTQKIKLPVEVIRFEPLSWAGLEPQLAYYQYSQLQNLLAEDESEDEKIGPGLNAPGTLHIHEAYKPETPPQTGAEKSTEHRESFSCYYTDAIFDTGCVRLVKSFDWFRDPVTITIENSFLLPEFDLVKSFFHKAFEGRKKFDVYTAIIRKNDSIESITAHSPQIASIDEKLIEGVKRTQVLHYIKTQPAVSDKSLFTAEEFLEHYAGDERAGNTLKQSEMDILLAALGHRELRNRKQIEYLAGKLQSPAQKIRFTLKPVFGFVFFTEGESMNHFCWELLNSHATYLWSFSKSSGTAAQQFRKVETSIASIRENGREHYKQTYNTQLPDPGMHFSVIYHRNASSGLIDGFPEWKHRLLERLI